MDLRGDVTGAPRELGPHPVLLASGTREEMRMSRERREGEARPPHGCGSSGTWLKTWPPLTLCGSIPLRLLRNYFRQCPRPRFFGDFGTHVMATLCGPICRLGCGTTRSTFYFSVTISFSFFFHENWDYDEGWELRGMLRSINVEAVWSRYIMDKGFISNQLFSIL